MKRFPISWDKTLTALGFRRNVKRVKRDHYRRRSQIETLEVRAMLSASTIDLGLEDLEEGTPVIVSPIDSIKSGPIAPIQPVFVLADSAAGDTPDQFSITTEYSESGQPTAVIKLKEGLERIDKSLQELTIELRLGNSVVERHEVLIDITESKFVHDFHSSRLAKIDSESAEPAKEIDPAVLEDWIQKIDSEGRFDDLKETVLDDPKETISTRTASATVQAVEEGTSEAEKTRAEEIKAKEQENQFESLQRIETIAKRQAIDGSLLKTSADKANFYLSLERTLADTPVRDELTEERAEQSERLTGKLALTLGRQLTQDIRSSDSEVAEAAQKARAELLKNSSPYYTLLTGLEANHELDSRKDFRGRTEFSLNIVEEGTLKIDEAIRVELGNYDAMVQTRTTWVSEPTFDFRYAAFTLNSEPVKDAFVFDGDPLANYNSSSLIALDDFGIKLESLLGFDLSAYEGSVPTSATLSLTPSFGTGVSVSLSAHDDLWGVDSTSAWDESTVTWDSYSSGLQSGFGGSIDQDTVQVGSPATFDVTETIQRSLLLGDSNLNSEFDSNGAAGDVEAFYTAATDFSAYSAKYAGLELYSVANGLIYRNDANLDGVVDASDASTYLKRMGVARGDFNLDGIVDGKDYSLWTANFGQSSDRFSMGDGNFNAVIDAADFTVWNDTFGDTSTTPATPEVTFRLLADQGGYADFYSSESSTSPPELSVTLAPRVSIQAFGTANGNLQVQYEVQHEEMVEPSLTIYQVVDGVRTSIYTSSSLQNEVGVYDLEVANSFTITNPDQEYTLVAEIESGSGETLRTWSDFEGGVFQTVDGKVHALGTTADDTITFENGRVIVSSSGTEIDSFTPGALDFNDYSIVNVVNQTNPVGGNTPFDEVQDNGETLYLENNTWKALVFPSDVEVTANTVIEFDFESTIEGEVHGFAFDDDLFLSPNFRYRLYGTQQLGSTWDDADAIDYNTSQGVRHYRVKVGEDAVTNSTLGLYSHLYFYADNDATGTGNSIFSNVRIYEDVPGSQPEIYIHGGDGEDTLTIENHTGANVTLVGGSGDDVFELGSSVDVESVAPIVQIHDEVGLDELKLPGWDAAGDDIDLESTSLQSLNLAAGGNSIQLSLPNGGVEAVTNFSSAQVIGPGYSRSFTVANLSDNANWLYASGNYSLREALAVAYFVFSEGDDGVNPWGIVFDTDLFEFGKQTLNLSFTIGPGQQEALQVDSNVIIDGPGADLLEINAGGGSRVFEVLGGVDAEIRKLTISGGTAGVRNYGNLALDQVEIAGNIGLGIESDTSSNSLSLTNSTIAENGGGIQVVEGTADLTNVTISGNTSTSNGGFTVHLGSAALTNVTITDNRHEGTGVDDTGGIYAGFSGTVKLHNSIVAGNYSGLGSQASDLHSMVNGFLDGYFDPTSSHNLIGDVGNSGLSLINSNSIGLPYNDMGLLPLSYYGGATRTYALLPSSIAVNAGDQTLLPVGATTDQRGEERVLGDQVDIGAYESGSTIVISGSDTAEIGSLYTASVELAGALKDALTTVVTIDWGDGDSDTVTLTNGLATPTHLYTNALQTYDVVVTANGTNHPGISASHTVHVEGDAASLGYSFRETGGSPAGKATVVDQADFLKLTEGDSLLAELSFDRTIEIKQQRLLVTYSDLVFSNPDSHSEINDAFEIALLDSNGQSIVPTIGIGRDSFFNVTEGLDPLLASGVAHGAGVVTVDVSHLSAGEVVTVVTRLVNNDGDTGSMVRIATGDPRFTLWGIDEQGFSDDPTTKGTLFRFNNYKSDTFESFGQIKYDPGTTSDLQPIGNEIESFALTADNIAYFAVNSNIGLDGGVVLPFPVLLRLDLNEVLQNPAGTPVVASIIGSINNATGTLIDNNGSDKDSFTGSLYPSYDRRTLRAL